MIAIAEYMTEHSKIPPYMPYPRFLLSADLTQTAKLLYALLLDRANLSKVNGWIDGQGRIYLVFTISKLADALDRSSMTVKNSLNELETAGLIERRRQGFSVPNRIYVKIPDGQEAVQLTDRKLSSIGTENCPTDGQKSVPMIDKKLSPNNMSNNNMRISNMRESKEAPAAFGRYGNVFLTDAELAELKAELPDRWEHYIERLSEYIASTGKKYQNHAATMRRWAADDTERATAKHRIPDYTCKEGESL